MGFLTPVGSRPVHKILDGADAPKWLHFAMNKLEQMRMTQTGPTQQHIIIGDVDIRIEKGTTWDRITIRSGGFTWVAIANNSAVGASNPSALVATQLAKSIRSGGPWTEIPGVINAVPTADISLGFDFEGAGSYDSGQPYNASRLAVPITARFTSLERIQSLGDGRFAFQTSAALEQVLYPILIGKDGRYSRRLVFPYSSIDIHGVQFGANGRAGYDVLFSWAVGPSGRVQAMSNSFCYMPEARSFNGYDTIINLFRFTRVTIDYIPAQGDTPLNPGENRQVVVTDSVILATNNGGGFNGFPEWIMLTPTTIMACSLYNDLYPYPSDTRYDVVSTDGGRNFAFFGQPINTGPIHIVPFRNVTYTSYAALNSKAALRLSVQIETPESSPGAGDTVTKMVVEKVETNGVVTLLYTVPRDPDSTIPSINSGTPLPGNPGESIQLRYWVAQANAPKIFAIGRNAFVIRVVYYYLIQAAVETGPPPFYLPAAAPPILTARVKTMRSYDGGATWDAPADTGFSVFNPDLPFSAPGVPSTSGLLDRDGKAGFVRKTTGPVWYPHKARDDNGPGEIYQIVTTLMPNATVASFENVYRNIAQTLYRSQDDARTWQEVAEIAHVPTRGPPYISGTTSIKMDYFNVIDRNAPIDPVFPWRMDARFEPPDWW